MSTERTPFKNSDIQLRGTSLTGQYETDRATQLAAMDALITALGETAAREIAPYLFGPLR